MRYHFGRRAGKVITKMRSIQLTTAEWKSLNGLQDKLEKAIPIAHRAKFLLLGVIAERAGKLVVTFEGRLQLREHNANMPSV